MRCQAGSDAKRHRTTRQPFRTIGESAAG